MSSRVPVELHPHSPEWVEAASREGNCLADALGNRVVTVHHIGSTAIPGICAKPILDLMAEMTSLAALEEAEPLVRGLGYEWWGEHGIPGRRFCTFDDPVTGRRRVHLHCFETGSPHIERHLAFRDYLRLNPEKAREYETEKWRCHGLYPDDSYAYSDAKAAWIRSVEREALASWRSRHSSPKDQRVGTLASHSD